MSLLLNANQDDTFFDSDPTIKEMKILKEEISCLREKLANSELQRRVLSKENEMLTAKFNERESKFTLEKTTQTDWPLDNASECQNSMEWKKENHDVEIMTAESIVAAAQSAVSQSGWTYDHTTGTYFDYNSNLYYYPNTRLYYNYKNGCYYSFNQETNKYVFHHQDERFCEMRLHQEKKSRKIEQRQLRKLDFYSSLPMNFGKQNDLTLRENIEHNTDDNKMNKQNLTFLDNRANVSDSELECIDVPHNPYMLCKNCGSILHNSCCKLVKTNSLDPPEKTLRGINKFPRARKLKCRLMRRKFLCHCFREEHSLSLSDSETVALTRSNSNYVLCGDCGRAVSATCCEKKQQRNKQQKKKRRRQSTSPFAPQSKRECKELKKSNSSNEAAFSVTNKPMTYSSSDLLKAQATSMCLDSLSKSDFKLEEESTLIPCIRAMVTSSTVVNSGTLYVVTCKGAVIGSSDQCEIQMQEEGIGLKHASITYNHEQKHYFVTDLGSNIGTILNSQTVCQPGSDSTISSPVTHKSILRIGSTTMVLHLHHGYDTCYDCEPGQIQTITGSSAPPSANFLSQDKETERRKQLKQMKKKFNLHDDRYKQREIKLKPQYMDRAAERRRTKGSDNPYEKDEMPTSLETELTTDNKGHQMLKKMGWEKGRGLGKNEKGITEPLAPQGTGRGKLGLGYGNTHYPQP